MGGDLGVGGVLAERAGEEFGGPHAAEDSGARSDVTQGR